jgi:CDP-diacylglycerol---glycerol-3-phosphate 3-phosphatidyltransferase
LSSYYKLKKFYAYLFEPVTKILNKANFHTNILTIFVFILTCFVVFFLLSDQLQKAAAIGILLFCTDILGSLMFDLKSNRKSKTALLDSIVDRYSEFLFYIGIMVYFIQTDDFIFSLFAFLTLIGSLMSSFISLRAKDFQIDLDFGFIRRSERILIASFGMFFGLEIFAYIMLLNAFISNITSFYLLSKLMFSK